MDVEGFIDRYGQEPGKDDLTILAPKQDDPTEQVPPRRSSTGFDCGSEISHVVFGTATSGAEQSRPIALWVHRRVLCGCNVGWMSKS